MIFIKKGSPSQHLNIKEQCLNLLTLNIFLPSLLVFVRLCESLSTSNVFLPSLCVFARLCVSLPVFACLCVSLHSLGVFVVFR